MSLWKSLSPVLLSYLLMSGSRREAEREMREGRAGLLKTGFSLPLAASVHSRLRGRQVHNC